MVISQCICQMALSPIVIKEGDCGILLVWLESEEKEKLRIELLKMNKKDSALKKKQIQKQMLS